MKGYQTRALQENMLKTPLQNPHLLNAAFQIVDFVGDQFFVGRIFQDVENSRPPALVATGR